MDNLIEYKDGASFFNTQLDWQSKIQAGRGWAYGGELLIEKKNRKSNWLDWLYPIMVQQTIRLT